MDVPNKVQSRWIKFQLIKYNVRLVAKGYTQQQGMDYEDTVMPTTKFIAIRLLLVITVQFWWQVYQMDVESFDWRSRTTGLYGEATRICCPR